MVAEVKFQSKAENFCMRVINYSIFFLWLACLPDVGVEGGYVLEKDDILFGQDALGVARLLVGLLQLGQLLLQIGFALLR